MSRHLLLIASALLAPTLTATAQQATLPPAVIAAANRIDTVQLKRDVHYLASDALKGRHTPSPGLDSAAAYVARRLAALRVAPAGDGGTYRQTYVIRTLTLDTVGTSLDVAGRRLEYGTHILVNGFLDTLHLNVPMVYVGHGMQIAKQGIDPWANLDVRGKIVVAHGPGIFPAGVDPRSMSLGIDILTPFQVAERLGAAALILVPPTRLEQRWERFRSNPFWFTTTEMDPNVPSAYARKGLPTVWIKRDQLGDLLGITQAKAAETLARADNGAFDPSYALDSTRRATLHIGIRSVVTERPHNVVARIEGRDPALRHEAVVLMSHLDGAVGPPPPGGADSIYNAADDNASGSSGLLAVAEAMLRAPRPRRSVVFVWDTGEEVGLWGSRFWAANPKVPLRDVVTHFNVDMIGRSRTPGSTDPRDAEMSGANEIFVVGPRVLSAEMDTLLQRTNRALTNLKLDYRFDRADHEFFYPRTDAGPVLERGVLILDLASGIHADYHGVGDEPQKLDLEKMLKVSRLVFATAWQIADSPTRIRMDKEMPASVPRHPAIVP